MKTSTHRHRARLLVLGAVQDRPEPAVNVDEVLREVVSGVETTAVLLVPGRDARANQATQAAGVRTTVRPALRAG